MNGIEHSAMMAVRDRMLDRFEVLASERNLREDFIDDGNGGQILAWQQHEVIGMTVAVNEERAKFGKPPVNRWDVETAERQACGHCDYATKCALYCAELVYGVFPLVKEVP